MKNGISNLYDEVIRKYNREPFHFMKPESADLKLIANNPLCGDHFDLYINEDHKKLNEIHFYGYGCALSKASTSIMLQLLEKKTQLEALRICREFIGYLDGSHGPSMEIFKSFEAVHQFAGRIDCVKLSWSKMMEYLEYEIDH
jgi:nitrogen fixation protein NifU and related proteins